MPRKPTNAIATGLRPGPGRPPGSRNKFPQLLRQLVLTAAEMSGYPTETWITEEALDEEGRQRWVQDTDEQTGELLFEDNNKKKPLYRKKMIRRRVLTWTGAQGSLGYLLFMAQEERNSFQMALRLTQQQQENKGGGPDEGLPIPTLEDLRKEWIRRGLRPIDFDRMKVVTGIQAKQRVRLIEHDPKERMRVRNGSTKQSREAASTTDPESEQQWWPAEEAEDED
jgi:hypothetical protein